VFLRIFEYRPSVKRMFPFRDAWGDQLIRHAQFVEQAHRFMRVIGIVVGAVDRLRAGRGGSPALYELGRRHVNIEGFLDHTTPSDRSSEPNRTPSWPDPTYRAVVGGPAAVRPRPDHLFCREVFFLFFLPFKVACLFSYYT